MKTIDIDGLLIEKGNAEQRAKELEVQLRDSEAYGKQADRELAELRAKLATVEAQAAGMMEAVNIALEAYSFISCGTREPIGISMKRPENELKVFHLVIALNNLRNKSESTDCGQSLLTRLEEARWLLSMSDLPSSKSNSPIKHEWYTRRDAWLSGHTASERLGKEAK